jgi:alpha-1,2-mannosyltransferase
MNRSTFPRVVTIIGAVLIIIGVILVTKRLLNALIVSTDFAQDYAAAMVLRSDESIYQHFTEAELRSLMPGSERLVHVQPELRNYHPPFNALLVLPLTFLPYDIAALLWAILSIVLYFGVWWFVGQAFRIHLPRHWLVLLIGLALCWYPFHAHLALGQLSFLLTVCVVGCWSLLQQKRDILAGILLSLACMIKLFPGLLLVYLLLRRRWWAIGSAIASMGVLTLLMLVIIGVDDLTFYLTTIIPHDADRFGSVVGNFSLHAAIKRLFIGNYLVRPLIEAPLLATALIILSSLGVVALLVYQIGRVPPTPTNETVAFALVCVAMLLLSPITWSHALLLLALPCGLFLRDMQEKPRQTEMALFLLALFLVSLPDFDIAYVLMQHYAPERIPWYTAVLLFPSTLGLGLFWWLVSQRFRLQAGAAGDGDDGAG